MSIPLFLCIGFFIAVVYMDLVFDVSALPYRKTGSNLPREVLDPIVTYYRYITKNPWLLVFCLLVAATSIVVQIVFHQVPPGVGYSSAVMIGSIILLAMVRVIPAAQRLASGKDTDAKQTRLVHGLFPSHIYILIVVLTLAYIQFHAAAK